MKKGKGKGGKPTKLGAQGKFIAEIRNATNPEQVGGQNSTPQKPRLVVLIHKISLLVADSGWSYRRISHSLNGCLQG